VKSKIRILVGSATLALAPACASGGVGTHECRPLDIVCMGKSIMFCHADPELLRQGHTVYVLEEADVCEDDAFFGQGRCVETSLPGGRIEAECVFDKSGSP
jgi:hypothetical protein